MKFTGHEIFIEKYFGITTILYRFKGLKYVQIQAVTDKEYG